MTDSVTELLTAIESGRPVPPHVLADDIVFDATVPNWRLTVQGPQAVCDRFAVWYADPGRFEELVRTPVEGGEIVRFLLTWVEHGVPYAASQAHFIELDSSGKITRDDMYCGGRWDAGLLAEMEEANRVGA